ncbi:DUF7507 domain-containing protein [Candidatus Roseilinea sp. NK_OTU-006]|uniref:DUF7507 domain-containing protein n=1 Tax=Candidatus Roseilinea sp. NK_OTU-006 TaxID=2704250 RepID=UPI00145D29D1|nr:SdrD B-like domain-containing protein [Candidatus Roseilinea sp. NK_OTU-006]
MQTRRRLGLVLAGGVLLASVWGATPARPALSAPQAPAASATLYPGGSVVSGYLETIWGGSGSARVLAPQTFLFGNGIPAPDLNIQALQGGGSNSWRATNISGGSVQFTGGALRIYSPPSGQTGWHFSTAYNAAACFGGCLGGATGVSILGTPNLVLQYRLNTGDLILGNGSITVFGVNQVHLSPARWVAVEVMVPNAGLVQARMRWDAGGLVQASAPVDACPNYATYGVAYRLAVNGNGSVDGYVRCANAVVNDWDAYGGTKMEQYVGTAPAGTLLVGSGYLVNVNAYGGQTSATQMTLNYLKNLNSAAATSSGQYASSVIDGGFGAQWTSVTCSGVQTYGSGAGNLDVYYRIWDSAAPGWSYLGTCNSDGTLSIPGAPRARYFQALFGLNEGSNGYRRLGGASVNYNPDTTAPTCTVSPAPNPGSWVSGNTSVTVTCTDNEALMPNGSASQNYGHTLNPNQGGQTVSGTACNRNNTCVNYSYSPYNRDSAAPNAPSLSLSGFSAGSWNPSTLNVGNNGDNGPSGVSAIQCSINGGAWGACPSNVSGYGHGTTIVARAVDNAGNVSGNSNTVTIQRDTQAPATAIGAITPEYRNTPPQLFYAPTGDGGSPFSVVRLLRRAGPTDPWTDSGALSNGMSWTPPGQGRWYVASKVTDEAGNVEADPGGTTDDATFFYDTVAPNAPAVLSVGPANSRTPNVTWSASADPGEPATGSGVQTYRVFILRPDNSMVTQYDVTAPTTNGTVNVALDDGNYIARVVAIDRAGNQSAASASYPFSVDSTSVFAGRVYSDVAPLGQYGGESGVAAVPVTLTQPTSAISTTTTDALGNYSFGGLEATGYYTVSIETPAGYVRTTPDQRRRLAVIGSDFTDIHFGLRYIGNQDTQYLWVDAQCEDGQPFPLAPFMVEGPGLNTLEATDGGGGWATEVSQPGVYTVTLMDAGLELVAPGNVNPVAVTVPAGGSGGAAFVLRCSEIADGRGGMVVRLYNADNPAATASLFAGQAVTASNGVSVLVGTTNAAGYVTFTGLISGTWVVTAPQLSGQALVAPGWQAYVQAVNVVAPLAGHVRYGYRAQNDATPVAKVSEDLDANGGLYVGDAVRYTLAVTNNTGITLTNVRITDVLPVGLQFNGIESVTPAGCNAGESSGVVLGLCPALGSGQAMRVVFTATVTAAGQNITNTFTWSADELAGEQPGGSCVNAPCGSAQPEPKARLNKRGEDITSNDGFFTGDTLRYTLRFTNTMAITQTNVRITDVLPIQLTLAGVQPPATCTDQSSGNTAAVLCPEVAPSAGVVVVITATVNASAAGQTITNTFTWSSDQGNGNLPGGCVNAPCDNDDPYWPPEPPIGPLQADKVAEDATDNGGLYVGDTVRYTLTVTNTNAITLTNVRITDSLPAGLVLVAVESVSAGCTDQSTGNTVQILCAALSAGDTARVVFTAHVQPEAAGQTLVNRFRWTAEQWPLPDNVSNDCANAPCGSSDPQRGSTGRKLGVGELSENAPVTYTLAVTNQTGVALTNLLITDVLPSQLQLSSVSVPSGCVDNSAGNTVQVSCASLPAGQSVEVTVYAVVVSATGTVVNSFTWTADNLGPDRPVECWDLPCDSEDRPDLDNIETAKVGSAAMARVGELITYTLTLSNSGNVTATATVTDVLDGRLTLEAASPTPDATSGGVLVWQNVSVPPGEQVVMTVTVRAGANTSLAQSYTVVNAMQVSYRNTALTRQAGEVEIMPWRAFIPIAMRPPELTPRVYLPVVLHPMQ